MVYQKSDNEVFLFDWKRSKKIINSNGSVEKQNPFENGLKGLSHLELVIIGLNISFGIFM